MPWKGYLFVEIRELYVSKRAVGTQLLNLKPKNHEKDTDSIYSCTDVGI